MKIIHYFIFLILISLSLEAYAGGPKRIATSDRTAWPYKLNSNKDFNKASRAEILSLANAWGKYSGLKSEHEWKEKLLLKNINYDSILKWEKLTVKIWLDNFIKAVETCADTDELFCPKISIKSWGDLVSYSESQWKLLPDSLKTWSEQQDQFYDYYLYEQLRLAALFPKITSEILRLHDTEVLGTKFQDKSFLLTFDDGPTVKNGETDKIISFLNEKKLNGVFFILGGRLDKRLSKSSPSDIKKLYKGMCIASHGYSHKSHQRISNWKESIDNTNKILNMVLPATQSKISYFRPPYGQRTAELTLYLNSLSQKNMLWNIDSQDWNRHISANQISNRIITLMLLWRKGILLFHDIHLKAKSALSDILDKTGEAGINWLKCK